MHSLLYRTTLRISLLLDLLCLATLLGAAMGSGHGLAVMQPVVMLAAVRIGVFGSMASDISMASSSCAHLSVLAYWLAASWAAYVIGMRVAPTHAHVITLLLLMTTGLFSLLHTLIYAIANVYLRGRRHEAAALDQRPASLLSYRRASRHPSIATSAGYGTFACDTPLKSAMPIAAAAAAEAASLASAKQRLAASAPMLIPQTPQAASSVSSRNRSSFAASGRSGHGRGEFSLKRVMDPALDTLMDGQANPIEEEEEEEEGDDEGDDGQLVDARSRSLSIGGLPRPSLHRHTRYINDHWDESVPFSDEFVSAQAKEASPLPAIVSPNHAMHPASMSVPGGGVAVPNAASIGRSASHSQSISKPGRVSSLSPHSLGHAANALPMASYSFFRNAYDTPMHSMPSPSSPALDSAKGHVHLSLTAQLQQQQHQQQLPHLPLDNGLLIPSLHHTATAPLPARKHKHAMDDVSTRTAPNAGGNAALAGDPPSPAMALSDPIKRTDSLSFVSEEEEEEDEEEEYAYGPGNPDGFLAPMIDLNNDRQSLTTTDEDEEETGDRAKGDGIASMQRGSHYSAKGQIIPLKDKAIAHDSPWSSGMGSRSSGGGCGSLKLNPLRRTVGFDIHAQNAAVIAEEREGHRTTPLHDVPAVDEHRPSQLEDVRGHGSSSNGSDEPLPVAHSLPSSAYAKPSASMLSSSIPAVPSTRATTPPVDDVQPVPSSPTIGSLPSSHAGDANIGRHGHGRMHHYVREAIQAIWCGEFDRAERLLAARNQLPRMAIHYTEIYLVRLLIGGHLKDREATLSNADLTEQLAGRVLDSTHEWEASFQLFLRRNYPHVYRPTGDPATSYAATPILRQNYRWDCMLARADALLFRAVLQMLSGGSEIKGAFNLRKSWKLYTRLQTDMDLDEETCRQRTDRPKSAVRSSWYSGIGSFGSGAADGHTEADEDLCDALVCGLGVFYFVLSVVPGSFLSILKAIGFSADRIKGIRLLNTVFERGGARASKQASRHAHLYM
ncbi:hypothetical protein SYNPS1DRAFT_28112 [Syncephalis pseudoplumigaleata]|uniref:Uncharacterized protein n=1 Tax=Syncephalis pseudoplumigaleata TaxID=1712513 RepID=A0A4P9Z2I5_9FUNG|nr:hypothetical protein SYNPS1DRAFT_28112 [Syncephalis pseudoplumigaleata]|eukprot:RKP26182.1 hypothetical protein SYNPS1DRAFT_28112 [Syncephalis pseudoplumigaleata]